MTQTIACTTSITTKLNFSFVQIRGPIDYITTYHGQMTHSTVAIIRILVATSKYAEQLAHEYS